MDTNKSVRPEPLIRIVSMNVTHRCNLACKHCYLSFKERNSLGQYIELEKFSRLLPVLLKNRCRTIRFTGGEPLLHPQFKEIYLCAKQHGFDILLFTNATCLSDSWIDFLERYPLQKMFISIYWTNDKEYADNSFDKTQGLFSKIAGNVKKLSKTRIPYVLQCRIPKNRPSLDMEIKEKLNTDHNILRFGWIFPRNGGDLSNLEDAVSLNTCSKREQIPDYRSHPGRLLAEKHRYKSGCGINYYSVHITSDWKIKPCIFHPHPGFDLTRFSYEDIVYKKIPEALETSIPEDSPCYTCNVHKLCRRCPAMGYGTVGPNTARDLLCRYTKSTA